jgi:hypothetical protein
MLKLYQDCVKTTENNKFITKIEHGSFVFSLYQQGLYRGKLICITHFHRNDCLHINGQKIVFTFKSTKCESNYALYKLYSTHEDCFDCLCTS